MDEKKQSPLQILQKEPKQQESTTQGVRSERKESPQAKREQARAYWERAWLTDPKKAATLSGSFEGYLEKERLESIWTCLEVLMPYEGKRVIDLGAGEGVLALRLQEAGAKVEVVDLSNQALRHLESKQLAKALPLKTMRAYVPYTELEDGAYDLVLCTGLVGELLHEEQRLLISELYRLARPDGHILAATALDTTTDGALEKWHRLLETELEIVSEERLYNGYFISLLRLTQKLPAPFQRMHAWLKETGWGAGWLSRRCRLFREESGVSHVATLAKRKPLQYSGEVQETPLSSREQRLKRRIWE